MSTTNTEDKIFLTLLCFIVWNIKDNDMSIDSAIKEANSVSVAIKEIINS